jgi:hypothetical protein
MRWEDERYVRIYTRDTPDWLAMQWQGRVVFYELARKVDRAGFVQLGKSGVRGLAGLLHMPVDVVEVGVEELLTDGCVVRVDGGLLIRNFIEAQETRQSDAARKRAQRERDRDRKRAGAETGHAVAPPPGRARDVTGRDHPSQNVTEDALFEVGAPRQAGQIVTPGPDRARDVTDRDLPSRNVTEDDLFEGGVETGQSVTPGPDRAQDVTDCDLPSRNVTECPTPVTSGHGASQKVTLCCAVPSRADISHTFAGVRARTREEPSGPEPASTEPIVTAETLLAAVGRHAMLSTLHGDRRWAERAVGGMQTSGCRATDATAAINAFATDKAAAAPPDGPALDRFVRENIGRFLKRAKEHGDAARARERGGRECGTLGPPARSAPQGQSAASGEPLVEPWRIRYDLQPPPPLTRRCTSLGGVSARGRSSGRRGTRGARARGTGGRAATSTLVSRAPG